MMEDLNFFINGSSFEDVEETRKAHSNYITDFFTTLHCESDVKSTIQSLCKIKKIIDQAWLVPDFGYNLGCSFCEVLRHSKGLDLLIENFHSNDDDLKFSSAQLLEKCLTTENREYVSKIGLEIVVNIACECINEGHSVEHARVGSGILEHLFKHNEDTCSTIIKLGGLDAVLSECRNKDIETLRHCAGALVNLCIFGGIENHQTIILQKVPMWLFPLAFHYDDNIKYYACLAIAVLVANTEIEADVLKSGTLDLVEPFVTSHNPSDFAKSNQAYAHGQSKTWLQKFMPVLSSKREEACNLAAFHFCMEAGIKKRQGNTGIFKDIGAIKLLKKIASCPNTVASKYAAQTLNLIDEDIPHKLSQQVPLWSMEDVNEWIRQIGFHEYARYFYDSRVDGDLLLLLNENDLKNDIRLTNGIQRHRLMRELANLKKIADYTSRDASNLNSFLQSINPDYSVYTYSMLKAGVDMDIIHKLTDEQLEIECKIINSIHRFKIQDSIKSLSNQLNSNDSIRNKFLDVFLSYRNANGSQLASLIKVHLQLRGFSVFIDVERLDAGKTDSKILQNIRQAKNVVLVLTSNALDGCIGDDKYKDWLHIEIAEALKHNCNIIPITDNFRWPDPNDLPEDMRQVVYFNCVHWIHDYQEACVDKLERFIRCELNKKKWNQ